MKLIVTTTRPIVLIDPNNSHVISQRPSITPSNQFIVARIGLGDVKILASELPDEATNEELQKFLSNSDEDYELAVQAYMSKFAPVKMEGEKSEDKAPKASTEKAK